MKTIAELLTDAFQVAIRSATGLDADPLLSPSQNAAFGDYQSNAAMGLAKRLAETTGTKSNPRAVAELVKAKLHLGDLADEITIAGPGFINVKLSPAWLAARVGQVASDDRVGIERAVTPQVVVVDYSGVNVAKQMHIGHLRSTIIGDAMSRVIEFQGNTVVRQNHIGDWGTQFGMLITFLRTSSSQSQTISDLDRFYKEARTRFDADKTFADESRKTVVALQAGDPEILATWKSIVDESMVHFAPIYASLGVKLLPADAKGESFYNGTLPTIVSELKSREMAVHSEGATVVFNDGFPMPLMIEKSGGGYLYATTDLAAIRYRAAELHADRIIYTHDSRQAQHFAQVFATARRAGWADGVQLEYAPFGTMLGEDNKPFKTRSGDTVKLKDLLDEAEERAMAVVTAKSPDMPDAQRQAIAHAVGIGAVKYADLSKDRISDYVFSWDKMLAMDGNTAPYLMYAYARIQSIFRRAAERGIDVRRPFVQPVTLGSPFELTLAKHVLRFGEIVEAVSRELKPHLLCTYLYELATRFSGFFENCPVLSSDEPLRSSRLTLCEAAGRTLACGLELLGIEQPGQM